MRVSKSLTGLFSRAKKSAEYKAQKITINFSEDVHSIMESEEITQAELARQLSIKPPSLSNALKPDGHNMTIGTMTKIAAALNGDLVCYIRHDSFEIVVEKPLLDENCVSHKLVFEDRGFDFDLSIPQLAACTSTPDSSLVRAVWTESKIISTSKKEANYEPIAAQA